MAKQPLPPVHGLWIAPLGAAQRGDLAPARTAMAAELRRLGGSLDVMGDYFYGRCLAEGITSSPSEPAAIADAQRANDAGEAILHLRRACNAEPKNPIFMHALALALARSGDAIYAGEATLLLHEHGLPHDLDLLGALVRTMEAETRSLPEVESDAPAHDPNAAPLVWPVGLPEPPINHPPAAVHMPHSIEGSSDILSQPAPEVASKGNAASAASKIPGPSAKTIEKLEKLIMDHEPWLALRFAGEQLSAGLDSAELQFLAGMASLDADLVRRARAHLARAAQLDATMLMTRTWLGRTYWRLGWLDLAQALWRSLPVEGPYDNGRHYHLALGHDALGQPAEAAAAMHIALRDFFYDTRQFYVERAFWVWADRLVHAQLGQV